MSDKKKTYKEIHGVTRVGNFLRGINKDKIIDVAAEIITGDLGGAVKAIFKTPELSEAEKEKAVALVQLDIEEQKGVSKRWESDMASDSYLSKNVRPLSLIFLTISTVLLIYLDGFLNLEIAEGWVSLLQNLLIHIDRMPMKMASNSEPKPSLILPIPLKAMYCVYGKC